MPKIEFIIKNPNERRKFYIARDNLVINRDFEDSGREKYLFMIRSILLNAGICTEDALNYILMLNACLNFPLSEEEVINATSSSCKREYKFTNEHFALFLDMTPEEIEYFNLKFSVPIEELAERRKCSNRKYYEKSPEAKGKTKQQDKITEILTKVKSLFVICF